MLAPALPPHLRRPDRPAGFTLIELMVVVLITSILLAVGVPALQGFIASNQLNSVTDSFAGALSEARSEAAKLGVPVALKTAGGINWGSGWTMFVDTNGNGKQDTGQTPPEVTLRSGAPLAAAYSLNSSASYGGLISFDSTGRLLVGSGTPAAAFMICQNGTAVGGRLITVTLSGRVRVAQNDASGYPRDDLGAQVTTCSP